MENSFPSFDNDAGTVDVAVPAFYANIKPTIQAF